jgi:hypothetical protein
MKDVKTVKPVRVQIEDIYIETRVSKNGNEYTALYVVDVDGKEHFVAYIH